MEEWDETTLNKHNWVLSNAGLSNALTQTGNSTSPNKIRFPFPVSFTIEYKGGIAEF